MNNSILIDTINLKTYAITPLDECLNEITDALAMAESLDIPNGFSYRTYLKNLASTIKDNKSSLKLVHDFIDSSIVSYNGIVSTTLDSIKAIPIIDLKKRESIMFKK